MRRRDSCSCRLLSYETRSLSFIFTILSAMYDNPRSYCYSHALCPRNLYLYTTLACCHSLLVLLPFASAHPATYYYAYLPRIGILTDGAFRTALANGVLVRSLGAMVWSICIRNVDLIRFQVENSTASPRIWIHSMYRPLWIQRTWNATCLKSQAVAASRIASHWGVTSRWPAACDTRDGVLPTGYKLRDQENSND